MNDVLNPSKLLRKCNECGFQREIDPLLQQPSPYCTNCGATVNQYETFNTTKPEQRVFKISNKPIELIFVVLTLLGYAIDALTGIPILEGMYAIIMFPGILYLGLRVLVNPFLAGMKSVRSDNGSYNSNESSNETNPWWWVIYIISVSIFGILAYIVGMTVGIILKIIMGILMGILDAIF